MERDEGLNEWRGEKPGKRVLSYDRVAHVEVSVVPQRKSAFGKVLQEAQQPQTQQSSETVEQFEKTSFYLTSEQVGKLDDLVHDHKKLTGQGINRNDIVRYLIDQATLDSLAGIKRHVKRQSQK